MPKRELTIKNCWQKKERIKTNESPKKTLIDSSSTKRRQRKKWILSKGGLVRTAMEKRQTKRSQKRIGKTQHQHSVQRANGKKEKIRSDFQEINFMNKTPSGQTRGIKDSQAAKRDEKKIHLDTPTGGKRRKRRETGAREGSLQNLA